MYSLLICIVSYWFEWDNVKPQYYIHDLWFTSNLKMPHQLCKKYQMINDSMIMNREFVGTGKNLF
jgi:hypothetical protein